MAMPAVPPATGTPAIIMAPKAPREWSSGLFDCFSDCGNCCMTFWCPCIVFGRNAEYGFGEDCTKCCLVYCAAMHLGVPCLVGAHMREKLREKYALREGCCSGFLGDCCTHCWCGCCAISQESREIKYLQNTGQIVAIAAIK